jgi:hypothetical protein
MNMALTRQASTTSAAAVASADGSIISRILYNDDANRAYVLVGPGTVTATNCSFSLAQYENASLKDHDATQAISVIWGTAGAGGLNVTSN